MHKVIIIMIIIVLCHGEESITSRISAEYKKLIYNLKKGNVKFGLGPDQKFFRWPTFSDVEKSFSELLKMFKPPSYRAYIVSIICLVTVTQ